MRVLHLSDTHLGVDRWFRGAPTEWSRADDHLAAMRRALAPAFAGEVDVVLHTGDVFDRSRPHPRVIAAALELFTEVARIVPLLLMPGNHDRHGLSWHFSALPAGLTVVDKPCALQLAGLRLAAVPFLRDPAVWAAAAAASCAEGVDLLLAHQCFDGSTVPGFVFRPGEQPDTLGVQHLPRGGPVVLNGHIHTPQELRLGDTRVIHVGSTERTSFIERAEPKGALVWHADGGHVHRVDTAPRPMVIVRGPGDLRTVEPEALVALGREARTLEMEAEVASRGGWVASWPKPSPQMPLFG
ncbi:hypothetical protein LBMAG42_51790 [Deltaproteobacteria bacterium]|nr:hypothetical protein LBMAG42_51790 [Deltaproteobacteria bacterium]